MTLNLTLTAADDIDADGPGSATTGSSGGGSFPVSAILDNFNRANEGPPPSTSWTTSWNVGADGHKVVSNQLNANTSDGSSYWNVQTFGPNCEVYATMVDTQGVYAQLGARLTSVGTSSLNGYAVSREDNSTIAVKKWAAGSESQLGATFSQSFTAGDSMGMTVTGSNPTVIEVWYKVGAGAWTSLGTRSDSTSPNTAAGNIGIRSGASSGSPKWDDFGGGTV